MPETAVPEPRSPEPNYQRGHMAARLAVRDCPNPESLQQLHDMADVRLTDVRAEAVAAARRVDYWCGYQQHLNDLRQETTP